MSGLGGGVTLDAPGLAAEPAPQTGQPAIQPPGLLPSGVSGDKWVTTTSARVRYRQFAVYAGAVARASCRCAACHPLRGHGKGRVTTAYAPLMRMLYMTTAGTSDPTRASIPLHLAVNGSLEVGQDVGVVLAGDATELLKTSVRESLEGVGVPPVRDLLAKAQHHHVAIYV